MQTRSEDRTLAYQIISYTFIFLLVIFIAAVLITRALFANITVRNSLQTMQHLAHEKVYHVEGRLIKVQTLAKTSLDFIRDFNPEPTALNEYLLNIISDNDEISSICMGFTEAHNESSIVHFSVRRRNFSRHLDFKDYQYQDWYQIPAISGKSSWIEPWFDASGNGKWIVSYAIPFYSRGVLTGVLRFDTELSYLQDIVSSFTMRDNTYSFLVSTTGTLITHKNPDLVMNHTLFSIAQEYHDDNLKKLGKAMLKADVGYIRVKSESPFGDSWIYYNPLPINKWSIGVVIPYVDLMKTTNLILVIQTLSSVLLFLVIAIVVYTRIQSVVKPLRTLTIAADKMGSGDFETDLPESDKAYEITKLTLSFKAMQQSIKEYIQNLTITTQEKDQIRGDVIYASEIQNNLIPKNTVHPFGIKELRVYGILEPAGDIGGDLFDYFQVDDEHFCFVVADVLGKGIVAAMTMTMVSTLLPYIAPQHREPGQILKVLNTFLCRNNLESNFITIILGILDVKTGVLEYSNCGHVPFYIRKMDRSFTKYSETHATALGVFEDIEIGTQKMHLNLGDEIVLMTDGITEAMNSESDFLGNEGLEKILESLPAPNPEVTAKILHDRVKLFAKDATSKDDITILVLDYKHPGVLGVPGTS